ncbi:MAG: serine/threonine-protein kinase [Enhygromyxa sp.]
MAIVRRFAGANELGPPEDVRGFMFGRFEVFDAMTGGMGLVLEARDTELDRKVAIKLWKQSGPNAQRALLAEAKTLALLDHDNIVRVYETGRWTETGRVYFVMEWIDGVDGQVWLNTPRSWREVRDVLVDAGRGLAAAHDTGIQHRDFKPNNMLVGKDGRTVVADFGIAESLRRVENTDPRWGTPSGTPEYMAPERLRGEPGDARSDQFSFCVALWRGLYGLRPFAGASSQTLLEAIELGELLTAPGFEVPQWLSEVVRRGLAVDPDDRHPSMHALIAALLDEPPDESADEGDEGDEGDELPRVEGRVLHQPAAVGWARGRGAVLAPLALVCGTVLGAGVMKSVDQRREAREERGIVDPGPAPTHPCAGVDGADPSVDVDLVVHEVCRLIRKNEFTAADMLWEREYLSRSAAPDAFLGEDLLLIASTLVDQAELLEHLHGSEAWMAARSALGWVAKAAIHLGEDDSRVQEIRVRAEPIMVSVAADD